MPTLRLPVVLPIDEDLRQQADRKSGQHVNGGVLLDKADRHTHHQHEQRQRCLEPSAQILVLQCDRENPQRVGHMQRRADPGWGVKGIDDAQHPGKDVLPWENRCFFMGVNLPPMLSSISTSQSRQAQAEVGGGNGEQKAVRPVKHSAVARDQIGKVLDADHALDERFHKITNLPHT